MRRLVSKRVKQFSLCGPAISHHQVRLSTSSSLSSASLSSSFTTSSKTAYRFLFQPTLFALSSTPADAVATASSLLQIIQPNDVAEMDSASMTDTPTVAIRALDQFAKSRLSNCISRHADLVKKKLAEMPTASAAAVEVEAGDENTKKLTSDAGAAAGKTATSQRPKKPVIRLSGSTGPKVQWEVSRSGSLSRAKCTFQLSVPPDGAVVNVTAVGFASSATDAEMASAMHGERLIDAYGVQLFGLAAMQTRHADAAIAAGRLAPYPPGHDKFDETLGKIVEARSANPPDVAVLPLAYVEDQQQSNATAKRGGNTTAASSSKGKSNTVTSSGPMSSITMAGLVSTASTSSSTSEYRHPQNPPDIVVDVTSEYEDSRFLGRATDRVDWRVPWRFVPNVTLDRHRDESEGGTYTVVEISQQYWSHPKAIFSPHVYNAEALDRVKKYFEHHKAPWALKEQPHRAKEHFASMLREPSVRLSIQIPGIKSDDNDEPVIAVGVARVKETAEVLCAMHAELLIDHYFGTLYPKDHKSQDLHAAAVWMSGRFAVSSRPDNDPPRCVMKRRPVPPKPMRELLQTFTQNRRGQSPDNVSRKQWLLRRAAPRTMEESFLANSHGLVPPSRNYLLDCNPVDATWQLVDDLRQYCVDQGHIFEMFPVITHFDLQFRTTLIVPVPIKYGLRGAYAVTSSVEQSIRFAARHAVEILCWLGIPLYTDKEKQLQFEAARKKMGYLVRPRDAGTGELIPAPPATRSPPGLRHYNEFAALPRTAEIFAMSNYDAHSCDIWDLHPDWEQQFAFQSFILDRFYARLGIGRRPHPRIFSGLLMAGGKFKSPILSACFPFPLADVKKADLQGDVPGSISMNDRSNLSTCEQAKRYGITRSSINAPLVKTSGTLLPLNCAEGTWILAMGRGKNRQFAERVSVAHAFHLLLHLMDTEFAEVLQDCFPEGQRKELERWKKTSKYNLDTAIFISDNPPTAMVKELRVPRPLIEWSCAERIDYPNLPLATYPGLYKNLNSKKS